MFQSVFSLVSLHLRLSSYVHSLVNYVHLSEIMFSSVCMPIARRSHLAIRFIGFLTLFLWVWLLISDYSISLLIWFLCSFNYVCLLTFMLLLAGTFYWFITLGFG